MLSGFCLDSCKPKEKISPKDLKKSPPPLNVDAYVVKVTAVSEKLEIPGSVISNNATEIHPEIAGRLTILNIPEGKFVTKGTLIAKIYDGDLKAQLNKLAIQLKVQEETARRYEELLKINGVSQQEYDLIKLQANNIRADMAIVQSNIQRTEVRAPFSGTLGLKMVSPGAYVTPQTVITSIQQKQELKLDFTLPEKYSGMINIGQAVKFTVAGYPKVYSARIAATEPGISESDRSLRVRCIVTNEDKDLLPGAFAKVDISFEPDENAIMIPSQAIIPKARTKQVAVFRNGEVSMENVTTAIRDSSMVQITSGLKPGDTIILTGIMSLKPKAKVTLNKVS